MKVKGSAQGRFLALPPHFDALAVFPVGLASDAASTEGNAMAFSCGRIGRQLQRPVGRIA